MANMADIACEIEESFGCRSIPLGKLGLTSGPGGRHGKYRVDDRR
jgi:hypothetical protein